jgi:hypothetical protein
MYAVHPYDHHPYAHKLFLSDSHSSSVCHTRMFKSNLVKVNSECDLVPKFQAIVSACHFLICHESPVKIPVRTSHPPPPRMPASKPQG